MLLASLCAVSLFAASGSDASPPRSRLERYLSRPLARSARHLDHGVIAVALAGGFPHRYRLAAAIGLLDHFTLGATAHWLPGESRPQWSPTISVALWRAEHWDVGVHYFAVLTPRDNQAVPSQTQWVLGAASFGHKWLSGGFDAGVYRARVPDPSSMAQAGMAPPSVVVWKAGGGLHLRAGTRRWGFTINTLAPRWMVEAVFDLRFGAFEVRPRTGGWRPSGIVWSTDRRVPSWR